MHLARVLQISERAIPTIAFLQGASSTTDELVTTFTSANLGAQHPTRTIVVCVGNLSDNPSNQTASVTVGGVSAVRVANQSFIYGGSVRFLCQIWVAKIPDGTSGNIVVTSSIGHIAMFYSAYRVTNIRNTVEVFDTDVSAGTADGTIPIITPRNGIAISAAFGNAIGANAFTWTGRLTENFDVNLGSPELVTFSTASGGVFDQLSEATASVSYNGAEFLHCTASWR